jgi:TonB family protein
MYFDFEDYHPDITPVGRAISWREGVLLSIIVHLAGVIVFLLAPRFLPAEPPRAQPVALAQAPKEPMRFVFVQPRVDLKALKPPERAEPSDQDRRVQSPEQAKIPNPLPLSRGNTRERVEEAKRETARGKGPTPDPAAGQQTETPPATTPQPPAPPRQPEMQSAMQFPTSRTPPPEGAATQHPLAGGSLGNTLQNLQRYVQRDQFQNTQGGGAFGPAIQFDTKGVEFGPWIRRFIAQVKRNWEPLIPLAAMSMKGHVVVTFNVHKDGSITDLTVVGPCPIDSFNTAAYGALASSNPTVALPPEYPADQAFFTVTLFYNEDPQ